MLPGGADTDTVALEAVAELGVSIAVPIKVESLQNCTLPLGRPSEQPLLAQTQGKETGESDAGETVAVSEAICPVWDEESTVIVSDLAICWFSEAAGFGLFAGT